MSWRLIIIPLLFVNLLYGCTGHYVKAEKTKDVYHRDVKAEKTTGVYHRVRGGETLWSIAKAYNINVQELAEVNNVTDPKRLEQDRVLFIPKATGVIDDKMSSVNEMDPPGKTIQKEAKMPAARHEKEEPPLVKVQARPEGIPPRDIPIPKAKAEVSSKGKSKRTVSKTKEGDSTVTTTVSPKRETGQRVEQKIRERDNGGESEQIKFDKELFIWPVKGRIRTKFGCQPNKMCYNGIEITAKEGTPVLAAASGTIMRSAFFKCCGETIIIKHENEYATVYYNLGSRVLEEGVQVEKGGRIAFVGKPEKKGESYLNFEIRCKNKARNPLLFLP
jgi:lipoprotein NlpD